MYQNGENLKTGDVLLYENSKNPTRKHIVIYSGKDENGNHYGYESAINKTALGKNGVQKLTGLQFPEQGKVNYYGIGTWREGQTPEQARIKPSSLRLTKIRRPKFTILNKLTK